MKTFLKKSCLLFGVLYLSLGSLMAQTTREFLIEGTLKEVPDSVEVWLVCMDEARTKLATCQMTNSSFKLQGTIEKPTYCILALLRYSDYWKELDNEVNFRFVVDETPVKIISTLSYDQLKDLRYGYKLEKEMQYTGGGKAFNEWQEYLRVLGNLPDRFDNLEYKWLCNLSKQDSMRIYRDSIDQLEQKMLDVKLSFAKQHPDSYVSSYLVKEEYEKRFVYTEKQLRKMGKLLRLSPEKREMDMLQNEALEFALNIPVKNFTFTTPENEVKNLTDYVEPGKCTLIDFWASWCGPCRNAIPRVMKIKERYGDKLNIVSISKDQKEEEWRQAMKEENMPWAQGILIAGQNKEATVLYATKGIPQLVLLDQKGNIRCVTFLPEMIEMCLEKLVKN